jgi:hypothetical protein
MSNDDAHLLTHGTRLEKIADEWLAQMRADRTADAAHESKVEQLTGIPACDAPPYSENDPYWIIREAVPHDHPGQQIDKAWMDIHARLFPLAENILCRRAYSPQPNSGIRAAMTMTTVHTMSGCSWKQSAVISELSLSHCALRATATLARQTPRKRARTVDQ